MAKTHQTIRIFISSPGDVAEEREGAQRVIDGLQRFYPGASLQAVLWEELALPATASFQETIDFLLEQEPIDIAVFILWSRLGSPLGAAITRADGTPYRSGTEREFDLMLTAFEQSGRKKPVILAYVREDDAAFRENLTKCPSDELEEAIQQRKLAESFVGEHFHDAEGRNLRAYQTYHDPVGFLQRLRVHLRRAIDDLLDVDSVTWTEEPYRGLQTFDIEHAPIFHGRDEENCDLLQRLRDQEQAGCAFVVIVAASGSGKSSLARAGVAANLVQQADTDDGARWRVSSFIPALADQNLCYALVRSLAEVLPELIESDEAATNLAEGLAENPALTVKLTIAPAFTRAPEPVRLLLILDQMEELWTDRHVSEEDRESFLAVVEAVACTGHVAVLATLRSDFYQHAQASPTFLRLKGRDGQFDLLPPDAASIHRLITEPARLSGLKFEQNETTGRSLDEVILEDASHDPHALPLLEYTLSELYRQRDQGRRLLTRAAYKELGGVEGAIGKRAEETFAALPLDAQDALDEVLPLLVSVDVGGDRDAVRRRSSISELEQTPARKTLTERFIAERFLTTDRDRETPVASLAHEALLHSWNRIVDWINDNREQLRIRARVELLQQRWEQQEQDDSLLLTEGLPLDEGRQLLQDAPHLLHDSTSQYIEHSVAFHERKDRKNRRTRRVVVSSIAALLLTVVVVGIASWRINRRNSAIALVQQLLTVEPAGLDTAISNLAPYANLARSELVHAYENPRPGSDEKLRAALSLLSIRNEKAVLPYVEEQLLVISPKLIKTVRNTLRPHKRELVADLWQVVETVGRKRESKTLHAASALADYEPNAEQWPAVAPDVVEKLVAVNPVYVADWLDALSPIQDHLAGPLESVFRDRERDVATRTRAAQILSELASDDTEKLTDLLVDAEPGAFDAVFRKIEREKEVVIPLLTAELNADLYAGWKAAITKNSDGHNLSDELRELIEESHGEIYDDFVYCQTLPLEQVEVATEQLVASGYAIERLRPYELGDGVSAACLWKRDDRERRIRIGLSSSEIEAADRELSAVGFRPTDVAGYAEQTKSELAERYAAVWVKDPAFTAATRLVAGLAPSEWDERWRNNKQKIDRISVFRGSGRSEDSGLQFSASYTGSRFSGIIGLQNPGCETSWNRSMRGMEELGLSGSILDLFVSNRRGRLSLAEIAKRTLAAANEVLMENPSDRNALQQRWQAHFRLGNNEAAIEDINKLLGKFSESFGVETVSHTALGLVGHRAILNARLGKRQAVMQDLSRLTEPYSFFRPYCLILLGDVDATQELVEPFVTQNDKFALFTAVTLYGLASQQVSHSDVEQSRSYREEAFRLLARPEIAEIGPFVLTSALAGPLYECPGFWERITELKLDHAFGCIRIIEPGNTPRTKLSIPSLGQAGINITRSLQLNGRMVESQAFVGTPEELVAKNREMGSSGYVLGSLSACTFRDRVTSAGVWMRPVLSESDIEYLAKRRVRAALALLRMGDADPILSLFQRDLTIPDPMTEFIHSMRECGVQPAEIWKCLNQAALARAAVRGQSETRDRLDRAMYGALLALGEFKLVEIPEIERREITGKLLDWYSSHPSSAVHSATGWVLRSWGLNEQVLRVDQSPVPYDKTLERDWYVTKVTPSADEPTSGTAESSENSEDTPASGTDDPIFFTMIVFTPGKYIIGSHPGEIGRSGDESARRVTLTHRIAVSDRELTWGQYRGFDQGRYHDSLERNFNRTFLSNEPVWGLTWAQAVAYCRRLTDQAGITKQCYSAQPMESFNPNALGYRLLTEEEWELVCRSGTRSAYSFGDATSFLKKYGWYSENSNDWPPETGRLRPNPRGLFDMHGGLYEWCHDWYADSGQKVNRGGGFGYASRRSRSSSRFKRHPNDLSRSIGFRIVRTLESE